MNITYLQNFIEESNRIEGENTKQYQLNACSAFLSVPITAESVKLLHKELSQGRHIKQGEWRDCQVYVGSFKPMAPEHLELAMMGFFSNLHLWDSWEAHNRFEKIHPFEDLNGRVGRMIWLHKALEEGYNGSIGFLHKYYYQTLQRYESI